MRGAARWSATKSSYEVVKSGRNRDNVRKHVSTIREAFREIDPGFDGIENVPMRGFRWVADAPGR